MEIIKKFDSYSKFRFLCIAEIINSIFLCLFITYGRKIHFNTKQQIREILFNLDLIDIDQIIFYAFLFLNIVVTIILLKVISKIKVKKIALNNKKIVFMDILIFVYFVISCIFFYYAFDVITEIYINVFIIILIPEFFISIFIEHIAETQIKKFKQGIYNS